MPPIANHGQSTSGSRTRGTCRIDSVRYCRVNGTSTSGGLPSSGLFASSDSCSLLRIDVDAARDDGTCLQAETPGISGVSLGPDGRQLYYSAEQDDTSDIGWMRLPTLASR